MDRVQAENGDDPGILAGKNNNNKSYVAEMHKRDEVCAAEKWEKGNIKEKELDREIKEKLLCKKV